MESIGRAVQSAIYRAGVYGRRPAVPVEPSALEAAAQRRMSARAWSYVAGSAGQQRTDRANTAAFGRRRVVPRMLVDVEQRDLSTTLLGATLPSPLLLAPIGVLEMAHRDAELAVTPAARALGTPMIVSTQASVPMEQVAQDLGSTPWWYQLYWSRSDELAASLVSRAEEAGAQAIVVTLDTHLLGWRTRDLDLAYLPFARGQGIAQYTSDPVFERLTRERAAAPRPAGEPRPTPAAVRAALAQVRRYPGSRRTHLRSGMPRAAVETFLDTFSRSSLTWSDLAWLRSRTTLPIVLKGLQHADDARLAVEHGVDAVVVSNHGGRQIDGAIASLDALPGVVAALHGRMPVLFDSGVRSGADAFVALALGADAVLLGRPWVYGLALAGARGVQAVLEHTLAELDLTMGLAGVSSVADIGPHCLAPSVE